MLKINLLPLNEKNQLRLNKNYNLVLLYGRLIFLLLFIFLVLLTSIWFYLKIQLKSNLKIISQLELSEPIIKFKVLEGQIIAANDKIQSVNKILSQRKPLAKIFEDLAAMTPPEIEFYSLYYDNLSGQASISGHALARESFIEFKSSLEKYQFFTQIDSPVTNLIKSIDNDFRINFMVK